MKKEKGNGTNIRNCCSWFFDLARVEVVAGCVSSHCICCVGRFGFRDTFFIYWMGELMTDRFNDEMKKVIC